MPFSGKWSLETNISNVGADYCFWGSLFPDICSTQSQGKNPSSFNMKLPCVCSIYKFQSYKHSCFSKFDTTGFQFPFPIAPPFSHSENLVSNNFSISHLLHFIIHTKYIRTYTPTITKGLSSRYLCSSFFFRLRVFSQNPLFKSFFHSHFINHLKYSLTYCFCLYSVLAFLFLPAY